jgi:hypothetical protein
VPLQRAQQRAWPRTRFTWVIGRAEARLMAPLLPEVEFITVDKRAGFAGLRALRRGFAGRRFDLLLHLQLSLGLVPVNDWLEIGRTIARFHLKGVFHADLNAHNLLLDGSRRVWLIDFDRGDLREPGLWCDANLARLRRSILKVCDALPAGRFNETLWTALLAGYRAVRPPRSRAG